MNDNGKWWDLPWNTATGCDKCSPACDNCWAQAQLHRFRNPAEHKVMLHPEKMDLPRRRKKPTRYFVCNRSDWMHPDIPDSFILKMLSVMAECPQHTLYTLTKRPERLVNVLPLDAPLGNLWIGITAWDQDSCEKAIRCLWDFDQFRTYLSLEPLLGPIDLQRATIIQHTPLLERVEPDWIIVGGENGPGARPMEPEWVYRIKLDCQELDIPFWFKGWGSVRERANPTLKDNYRLPEYLPRQRPEGG